MKKQIIITTVAFMLALFATIVQAQTLSIAASAQELSNNFNSTLPDGAKPVTVSNNLEKKFRKQFPSAADAQWYETSTGFVVHFSDVEIKNIVFLDKKGNTVGQLSYCSEKDLPANVRQQVRSNYYDYSITFVKELTVGKAKAYLVTVEDKTSWKIIRVTEEGMDVFEEHIKG
ncbi:MAG: hypothetical protein ACXVBK_16255 [Flavisolibacter sp.]